LANRGEVLTRMVNHNGNVLQFLEQVRACKKIFRLSTITTYITSEQHLLHQNPEYLESVDNELIWNLAQAAKEKGKVSTSELPCKMQTSPFGKRIERRAHAVIISNDDAKQIFSFLEELEKVALEQVESMEAK